MAIPTAADMVDKIKQALFDAPAGLVTVVVDGQTTTWDRAQALRELSEWERRAARERGGRPGVIRVNMTGF